MCVFFYRNCEIATIFLILELQPLTQQMGERERSLLAIYMDVGELTDAVPPAGSVLKEENDFLLVQSFVMAIGERDADRADFCLTELMPRLKNAFLLGIGLDLVEKVYREDLDAT